MHMRGGATKVDVEALKVYSKVLPWPGNGCTTLDILEFQPQRAHDDPLVDRFRSDRAQTVFLNQPGHYEGVELDQCIAEVLRKGRRVRIASAQRSASCGSRWRW